MSKRKFDELSNAEVSKMLDPENFEYLGLRVIEYHDERKSKEICKQLLSTTINNDSDSEQLEESEHDSDNDPEFQYSDASGEMEDAGESSKDGDSDNESDSNISGISNLTEFNETINLLNDYNDSFIPSKKSKITTEEDIKPISQRKLSQECTGIFGIAQKLLWDGKHDEAIEVCKKIIKGYPSFPGAYDVLAEIYSERGDFKRAAELKYTSVMCDPKNTDLWIVCIENTKTLEGVERAVEMTKSAISRNNSVELRKVLIQLLEETGRTKEALVKRLVNASSLPVETDPVKQAQSVRYLFDLAEKFEANGNMKRYTECLEIIDLKYPAFLTDARRLDLLKLMLKAKRFVRIFQVANNLEGVTVNVLCSSKLMTFTDDVSVENQREIIIAVLSAIVNSKMDNLIVSEDIMKYFKQASKLQEEFLVIMNKLYDQKYYRTALELLQDLSEHSDDKLAPMKLFGKCQEALELNNEALNTYNYIISEIDEQDASVWELKANLLYRLKREDDAIHVLAESQKFIRQYHAGGNFENDFADRLKPTKESLQLLHKLCQLLKNEGRIDEFIKVAWKFLFIDSYEYFKLYKIKMCCEDFTQAKTQIHKIQNNIWLCYSKSLDAKNPEGKFIFKTIHSRAFDDSATWDILIYLLKLFSKSPEENTDLIELLIQWGLLLHKIVNWSHERRIRLSSMYVCSAVRNRLRSQSLRLEVSGSMIFQELRFLRKYYGEKSQFWNLFQLNCHINQECDSRFILRALSQTKNIYPLELINAGQAISSSGKLSLAIHNKLYFERMNDPLISLHMAITLANSALSRTSKRMANPMMLAISFLYNYRKLRGDCQETFYNLGRFCHKQNNEVNAIQYYMKVLELPPTGKTDEERASMDLSKEAAFNLIYILKRRNNKNMLECITRKYLTI